MSTRKLRYINTVRYEVWSYGSLLKMFTSDSAAQAFADTKAETCFVVPRKVVSQRWS